MRAFKLIATAFWTLIFIMHFTAEAKGDTISTIDFEGASITAGMKASLPLELRVRDHLSKMSAASRALIAEKKVLIALDYFFPTNFSQINDSPRGGQEFQDAVDEKINEWTRNNDYVVIGLLPDVEALDIVTTAYIRGEGQKFATAFSYINDCCRQRAAIFNARVMALAAAEPKIRVFDLTNVITAFRREQVRGVRPNDIYADKIHVNDKGQAVLFNLAIRDSLEAIYGITLPLMEIKNLNSNDVSRIWDAFSLTRQDFANRRPGLYRAELMNEGLRNGRRFDGTVQNSDLNRRRLEAINNAVKGASGESTTIPVELRTDGSIVLDLVGALQYVPMPLQVSRDNRTYVGYGYDYWKFALLMSNLFNVDYYFAGLGGNAVGVNYMFQLQPVANRLADFNMTWRVFPVLTGQMEVEDRQPVLAREQTNILVQNHRVLPHLTYQTLLRVVHGSSN